MKTSLLLSFVLIAQTSQAQSDSSGVYKTSSDFLNGKLTYAIHCGDKGEKIKLHDFANQHFITIVHKGKKIDVNKSEVFGYRDCNKKMFRFEGKNFYQILNADGLCVYQHEWINTDGKAMTAMHTYLFSTKVDSPLQPLTIANLKKAFPSNDSFHDMLDSRFKSDEELHGYDEYLKTYKVVHAYRESLK